MVARRMKEDWPQKSTKCTKRREECELHSCLLSHPLANAQGSPDFTAFCLSGRTLSVSEGVGCLILLSFFCAFCAFLRPILFAFLVEKSLIN